MQLRKKYQGFLMLAIIPFFIGMVPALEARPYEDGRLIHKELIIVNKYESIGIEKVVFEKEYSFPNVDFIRVRFANITDRSMEDYEILFRDIDYNLLSTIPGSELKKHSDYWSDLLYSDYILIQVRQLSHNPPRGLVFEIGEFIIQSQERIKEESHDGSPVWKNVYEAGSDEIWRISRSIAKLSFQKNDKNYTCTGFLITESSLLTNQHCVSGPEICENMLVIFGYEFDKKVKRQRGVQYRCKQIIGSPVADLDYTIIQVKEGPEELNKWGHLDLSGVDPEGSLYIIQHPGGDYKKIVNKNCFMTTTNAKNKMGLEKDFGHKCDTEDGSSGAPIFDSKNRIVGLHHLGWEKGSERWLQENRAVYAKEIIKSMSRAEIKP